MTKEIQKRITELLEEKKNNAERRFDNAKKCCIEDNNFISYYMGSKHQAIRNFENLKLLCSRDISLEAYVALIESIFKNFKYIFKTMVKPTFGKDTSNYKYVEGRIDEMKILLVMLKKEKNNKKENENE